MVEFMFFAILVTKPWIIGIFLVPAFLYGLLSE